MRLRTEITLILTGTALTAVAAATVMQAVSYSNERLARLNDLHGQVALQRTWQLESQGKQIFHEVSLAIERGAMEVERTAKERFHLTNGQVWLKGDLLYAFPGPPANLSLPPETKGAWGYALLDDGTRYGPQLHWVGHFSSDRAVVLRMGEEWLSQAIDSSTGTRLLLLTPEARTEDPSNPSIRETAWLVEMFYGEAGVSHTLEYRGVDNLFYQGTFTRLEGSLPLILLVSTPLTEFRESVKKIYRKAWTLAAICASFCVLLGFLFSSRLAAPLRELAERSAEVARGKFGVQVVAGTARGNEVGLMARSFNKMSADLRQLREELRKQERLSALGAFSAGLVHEVKNPIAGILTSAQVALRLLQSGPGASPAVVKSLETVTEETKRANRILSQLMQFSRKQEPPSRPLDLTAQVRKTLAQLQPLVAEAGAKLETSLDGEGLVCLGNGDEIHQVLLNLAQNSLHALRDRPEKNLRVSLTRRGAELVLEVADSGTGIAPEAKERLFEPFFTTKPMGEGTGLGLSVCHGIIANHGGHIAVESEWGKGTIFRVVLPAAETARRAA